MIVLYCIVNGVAEKLQLATELYDYGAMVKVNAVAVIIFVAVWWIPHGPHKLTIGQDSRNALMTSAPCHLTNSADTTSTKVSTLSFLTIFNTSNARLRPVPSHHLDPPSRWSHSPEGRHSLERR